MRPRPQRTILRLLREREEGASICPSEAARALAREGEDWRVHMDAVRDAAAVLAEAALVEVTQRGARVAPPWRGPIRIRRPAPLVTPDGRYLVVRGRLWRHARPDLAPEERDALVATLMTARRDVARAKKMNDEALLVSARRRVHAAKVALGERGPVWWTDGAPDENRRRVENTRYARWYAERTAIRAGSSTSRAPSRNRE